MSCTSRVTLSIVSHGQGKLVGKLLSDLSVNAPKGFEIIVTINIPEDESYLNCFDSELTIIRNNQPKGFGANHNAAFQISSGDVFVIVNPDIRIHRINWDELLAALSLSNVGACAPLVYSSSGKLEDSARVFPTFWRLVVRVMVGERAKTFSGTSACVKVDWLAGMFVLYRRAAFKAVKGFDEHYHMYLEDADICLRLKRAGFDAVLCTTTSVVHDARRASHRSLSHLRWHLCSAFRYLLMPFRTAKSSIS